MKPRCPSFQTAVLVMVLSPLHLVLPRDVEATDARVPLDRVEVMDLGDRLRVEIQGNQAIRYTASTSTAPAALRLELPGFSQGEALRRMDINQPPVLELIPQESFEPHPHLELVFRLSSPVEPRIMNEGTRLTVDFSKPPAPASVHDLPRTQAAPPEPATRGRGPIVTGQAKRARPAADPLQGRAVARAQVVTKVEVQRGSTSAVVTIFGDGPLTYNAQLVDQSRLVVDLPTLSSALGRKVLPIDHPLLKRIRIGKHVDRLRLVFDLPRPVAYTVQHHDAQLRVSLKPAGSPEGHEPNDQPKPSKPPKRNVAESPRNAQAAAVSHVALRHTPVPEIEAMAQPRPRLAQMGSGGKAAFPSAGSAGDYRGRRISLDFQGADITNVLRLIAEVSGFNIVIGDGVKAKVTMKLVNIPWDQALDMLLKMNNLGMVKEGNIIWIDTLQNIAKQREATAKAEESKIKAEKLVTKLIWIHDVKAEAIMQTIKQHLSPRGQIQVDKNTNALVLQETESKIGEIEKLVHDLDIESPQVQIEARIVQADTNFSRSLGVQWGLRHSDFDTNGDFQIIGNLTGPFSEPNTTGGEATFERSFLVNLPAAVGGLPNIPGVGFNMGRLGNGLDIDLRLSAGELLGLTKVIAAPRITTLDNQEAKIEQGESIPYQTTSLQGTQTTFVDANLTLQVTPQITSRDPDKKDKNILLKVKATRNAVGARSTQAGPSIDKREATTQVMVRDGETVVIGGIFVDTQNNQMGGVPYLSRIPVLGWLFKNKTESVAKQELLIFLTPTIVKENKPEALAQ